MPIRQQREGFWNGMEFLVKEQESGWQKAVVSDILFFQLYPANFGYQKFIENYPNNHRKQSCLQAKAGF